MRGSVLGIQEGEHEETVGVDLNNRTILANGQLVMGGLGQVKHTLS